MNELFEKHQQYRGWYKSRNEWVLNQKQEAPVETEVGVTEEDSHYVEYDVNRCKCGFCGERLEYVELDDGARKGWL